MSIELPAYTAQERHVLRQLAGVVGTLDYWRAQRAVLERQLSCTPSQLRRERLIRDLFEARRREVAATLDLRDGAAYVAGLVAPAAEPAP